MRRRHGSASVISVAPRGDSRKTRPRKGPVTSRYIGRVQLAPRIDGFQGRCTRPSVPVPTDERLGGVSGTGWPGGTPVVESAVTDRPDLGLPDSDARCLVPAPIDGSGI